MAKKKHPSDSRRQAPAAQTTPAALPRTGGRARAVLAVAAVLLAAGGFLAWRQFGAAHSIGIRRTPEQNVLLVTIDTWRADALGASGSGKVATPALDRLASLGTRFEFAHAHVPLTLPSHASILTGLYPFQHGVRENAGFRLASKTGTLAAMLRSAGLATGAFVASFAVDSRFGLNAGFDVYDERYGKSNVNAGFLMPERRADAVVAAATTWISSQKSRWFAWVHLFDPHAPYRPPAPFDRQYGGRPYYGEVAYVDAMLAQLFDAVRDSGSRPTLVIVTGDHGEGLGDHGEATHGLFAYEATLHVPLLVAQIDRASSSWRSGDATAMRAGTVVDRPVRHVDIVPTILDAVGLAVPPGLPGRSLFSTPDEPATSYFEALSASLNRGWAPLTGVLSGREKYVSLPIPELYDLATDPAEGANLADRRADRVRVLSAFLQRFGPAAPGARAPESADARERLQALGYVTGSAPRKTRYTEEDDPKRLVAVDQQLRHAIEIYERGDRAAAVPVYRQIIAERPSMELAYSQLAMLQWEMGQPQDAIATLRAAIAAGQSSLALRAKLGIYLAESGAIRDALPLLETATAADGSDVDAMNALGIALARAGRRADAAAAFERLLAVDPSNTMAVENLGSIALAEGRWEDARRYFSRALDADPSSTQAHNGMGVAELRTGNRRAAIEHWRQSVARDAENFDALYNLATELVNDGQAGAARPFLEQFERTAPPAFYAGDIARVRSILARMGK